MAKVTIKQMAVRGFGPYQDEALIELSPAANVLVAPNEAGKSTLAAALAAILYGLPSTTDPERFGQGRYRHWGQAARFEGELFLSVDATEYHLARQFETHKVTLRRHDGDRWRVLLDGVADNPESRRPNPQYRQFLQETIGLENRELFEATFCLSQPLPNEVELDSAIQQLLSGSGNHYVQVGKVLETKIKELTRYYGLALGDKSKGHKDRRLEQVESEIIELEQRMSVGRNSADGLQTVQRQLQDVRRELNELQERFSRREALERAWSQWRTEKERHAAALNSYLELEQAFTGAKALEARLSEIEVQISQQYSEFRTYGEELAPHLEQMEQVLQQLSGVDSERSSIQAEMLKTSEALSKLELEQQALPEILRTPLVAADHARLLELSTAHQSWKENQKTLEAALGRIETELGQLPDFSSFSEHPTVILDDLAHWLDECVSVTDRWQARKAELNECEATIKGRYGALVSADQELRRQAAKYSLRLMELTQAEQSTRQEYEQLAEHEIAYQRAEQEFTHRFGEPAVSAPDLLPMVKEKLQLLSDVEWTKGEKSKRRVQPFLMGGAWVLAAALGGLAVWLIGGVVGWMLCFVLVLSLGGATQWLIRSTSGKGSPSDELLKKMARLDQSLGKLSSCGLQGLSDARAMLEQLALLAQRRPEPGKLASLLEGWERAQAELAAWSALVQPLRISFVDPQAAYDQWQELEQERTLLLHELRLLSQRLGCGDDLLAPDAMSQLMRRPHLKSVLGLLNINPKDMGEMAAQIREQSARWSLLATQALRWESLQREREQLAREYGQANQHDADGLTPGERLAKDTAALRQSLWPFTEDTPTQELHAKLEQYGMLAQEIAQCKALIHEQLKRLDAKTDQASALNADRCELLRSIAPVWESSEEDLARLRTRYREYAALAQEMARVRQGLQSTLQSRQVDQVAALERVKTDRALDLVAIKTRWQALIDQHPGLPSQEEANQGQTMADQYRDLQDELTALRERIERVRGSEDELRRRQADLHGQSPINIPAASDELLWLKAQQTQLKREVSALGLAYRELQAAISEYEGSYRERLADQTNTYFKQITGDASRTVELATDFSIGLSAVDGHTISIRQLSQGARDQLYISLRLAIADLMADSLTLPMILDDPFVNCDQERLERSRAAIRAISGDRQVLLLTHQPQMRNWGKKVVVDTRHQTQDTSH